MYNKWYAIYSTFFSLKEKKRISKISETIAAREEKKKARNVLISLENVFMNTLCEYCTLECAVKILYFKIVGTKISPHYSAFFFYTPP